MRSQWCVCARAHVHVCVHACAVCARARVYVRAHTRVHPMQPLLVDIHKKQYQCYATQDHPGVSF